MSSSDVLISAQAELKYENKKTDSRVFTSHPGGGLPYKTDGDARRLA